MARLPRRTVLVAAGALGLAAAGGLTAREIVLRAGSPRPGMTVTRHEPGTAPGRILFTYGQGAAIADAAGIPLWTTSGAGTYTNFQVQRYRGQPVFTWWQGAGGPGGGGSGSGTDVVTSLAHAPVASIGAAGGFQPDPHELLLTTSGTALITSYALVSRDLSTVGGPAGGQVLNGYCEEVDLTSGAVLHRWSALEHVPLTDSFLPLPDSGKPYDFFHINSISVTPDGHLLVSARHTCALYKVHRTTGAVLWRLGGKSSSFAVAPDAAFGFQHHAAFEDPQTIRLFDNGGDGITTLHPTRVAWIRVDPTAMTATLAASMTVPGIQTGAMGSAQRLPNGNVFVGWGSVPRLTEFSPRGDVLFDATLAFPSYRVFKADLP